jgi:hypothetical protein
LAIPAGLLAIFPATDLNELLQMHFSLLGWPQQKYIDKSPLRDNYFEKISGIWSFKNITNISTKMRVGTMQELFDFIKTENELKKESDPRYI